MTGPRIVVVGAGHAGLAATHGILTRVPGATVTLLEPRETHLLKPRLLEALAEDFPVEIPLEPFVTSPRIRWVKSKVVEVDAHDPAVVDEDDTRHAGDFLVIASGTRTRKLPGVPKRGTMADGARRFRIDSLDSVLGLRDHLSSCVERASAKISDTRRRALLSVLVIGGGYTGVESAAEVALFLRRMAASAEVSPALVHVTLCEQRERLFAGGVPDEELERRVDEALARKGVDVRVGLEVRFQGGVPVVGRKESPAATVILANGIEGVIPVPRGAEARSKRWAVDRFLEVQGRDAVFAVGDAAIVEEIPGAREPVVASAQHAVQAGAHVAKVIAAQVKGKTAPVFEPSTVGEFVTLGEGDVVGWVQIAGRRIHLSGLPASAARAAAFARYLTNLRIGAFRI